MKVVTNTCQPLLSTCHMPQWGNKEKGTLKKTQNKQKKKNPRKTIAVCCDIYSYNAYFTDEQNWDAVKWKNLEVPQSESGRARSRTTSTRLHCPNLCVLNQSQNNSKHSKSEGERKAIWILTVCSFPGSHPSLLLCVWWQMNAIRSTLRSSRILPLLAGLYHFRYLRILPGGMLWESLSEDMAIFRSHLPCPLGGQSLWRQIFEPQQDTLLGEQMNRRITHKGLFFSPYS